MSFERRVPATESETEDLLLFLQRAGHHLKSMYVSLYRLEVDLDWAANRQFPDFYIPIRTRKVQVLRDLLPKIEEALRAKHAPPRSLANELFQCIDPGGL